MFSLMKNIFTINKLKKNVKFLLHNSPIKKNWKNIWTIHFKTLIGNTEEFKASEFDFKKIKEMYHMQLYSGWTNKIVITTTVTVIHKKDATKRITKSEYVMQ